VMYASGFGVTLDEAESVRLLARARRAGGLNLSVLLEQVGFPYDPRLVEPDWNRPPDPVEEQAARAGDPVALYQTALRVLNGAAMRQDIPGAIDRLERAARAGLGSAQFTLALMYANGLSLPQDYENAYVWASRAALAAVPEAGEVRDALSVEMSADQLRRAQGRVADLIQPPR
jgi:TPR repeat protein